jgi:hypothetical protein
MIYSLANIIYGVQLDSMIRCEMVCDLFVGGGQGPLWSEEAIFIIQQLASISHVVGNKRKRCDKETPRRCQNAGNI